MLAGVSVDYCIRLQRGNLAGVSLSVLDAVATTLRLDWAATPAAEPAAELPATEA
jgi:hypothetical protein